MRVRVCSRQVDLVCLAEFVHLLLTKRKMTVVKEKDGWMVEKLGRSASRYPASYLPQTQHVQHKAQASTTADIPLSKADRF